MRLFHAYRCVVPWIIRHLQISIMILKSYRHDFNHSVPIPFRHCNAVPSDTVPGRSPVPHSMHVPNNGERSDDGGVLLSRRCNKQDWCQWDSMGAPTRFSEPGLTSNSCSGPREGRELDPRRPQIHVGQLKGAPYLATREPPLSGVPLNKTENVGGKLKPQDLFDAFAFQGIAYALSTMGLTTSGSEAERIQRLLNEGNSPVELLDLQFPRST